MAEKLSDEVIKSKSGDRIQIVTVALLSLVGAVIRIAHLFQPMKLDEITTFFAYTTKPLLLAVTKNYPPNNPHLHTLFVNLSTRIFGQADWAIRLPAFIAGLMMIPLTYYAVKRLYNGWAGMMASALVAASPLLIAYSTSARGYTIQAVLVLGMVILASRLKVRSSKTDWVLFSLVGILAMFTVATSLYFVGAVYVWLLISALAGDVGMKRSGFIIRLAIAGGMSVLGTAALYAPVILRSGIASITSNPMVQPLDFGDFSRGIVTLAHETWISWNLDLHIVITVIIAIGFIASVIFHGRMSENRVNLSLVLLGWIVLILLVQRAVPYVRTWIPLLPLYWGFACAGLVFLGGKTAEMAGKKGLRLQLSGVMLAVLVVALCIFLCGMTWESGSAYQSNEWGIPSAEASFKDAKVVADFLASELRPGDIVMMDYFAVPSLEYYLGRLGVPAGYLYLNDQGAENVSDPRRILVVDSFSEGHTIEEAAKGLSDEEIESLELYKEFEWARIFTLERPLE